MKGSEDYSGSLTVDVEEANLHAIGALKPNAITVDLDKALRGAETLQIVYDGQKHVYKAKDAVGRLLGLLDGIEDKPYAEFFEPIEGSGS